MTGLLRENESLAVHKPHSILAEMIVHRAFIAADPTARHVGGNTAIRDHELLHNTAWCNTKSGWLDYVESHGELGFSPVNWAIARNRKRPKWSLDLIAIVPLRQGDIEACWTDGGIVYRWPALAWYLMPASILQSKHRSISVAHQRVPMAVVEEFRVSEDRPLNRERLRSILASNVPLPGSSPYEFD